MNRRIINQLAEAVLIELEKQHYAEITITHFRQAFDRLKKYAAKIGEVFLSDRLIRKYLFDVYGWVIGSKTNPTAHVTSQLRAIRILQFYEENCSIPGRISNDKEPPNCFRCHYDLYISECAERGLSSKTIANRANDICDLLVYAKRKGFTDVIEIDKELLGDYLRQRSFQAPGAMPRILSSVRCFLRCMFANGAISNDLSFFVPLGSRYPRKPVQKLWTDEKAKDLLGFLNRSDSIGKRDYALILLVLRYGMRAGDVLNLKLSDINWENMTIQFCQEKTSVPNALPILTEQ